MDCTIRTDDNSSHPSEKIRNGSSTATPSNYKTIISLIVQDYWRNNSRT